METTVENTTVASVPKSKNDSLERVVEVFEKQRSNLQNLRNSSVRERKKKLNALKKAIFNHREKIQQALYNDFKKQAPESDLVEIYPAINEIRHTISHLSDWVLPLEVDVPLTHLGASCYVNYEPKGNCLVITPWNYPFFLAVSPIVYAVAAGNATILKPSEFTPHTSQAVKEMLADVFDENEVAVVQGDHVISGALLKQKFNHIHFTGSPMVGKLIMKAAAEHLATCTLELGGKSPVIVDESANTAEAARKIVWGKYLNKGQTCIAPDYMLVHKSKKAELMAKMKEQIANNYGASEEERKSGEGLCRMVNSKHYNRVKNLIESAVKEGATVEAGGKFDDSQNYIDPTILTNVNPSSEIMSEEIFGPVLPVIEFDNLEESLAIINAKERPLALYLFSNKGKNIDKVMNETTAGGTCINDTILHVSQPNLPFGGINNSGIGKSHGKWGFIDFSNERAVMKQHTRFSAAQLMHPPYTKFTKRLIEWTMKYM
jgi:aldehyde dehydrogenase (NAD+)